MSEKMTSINPNILVWCREASGVSIEEASLKFGAVETTFRHIISFNNCVIFIESQLRFAFSPNRLFIKAFLPRSEQSPPLLRAVYLAETSLSC